MLRKFIVIIFLYTTQLCFSQDAQLAYSYFRNGEYEKAKALYKELYKNNPVSRDYFKNLLSCYQLTADFESAGKLLEQQQQAYPNQANILIEKGYNDQLQNRPEKAREYYELAIATLDKNPHTGYILGKTFQDNHLLDYALRAYKKSMEINPQLNYSAYIAFIYGEQGDIENMFDTYLDMVQKNPNYFTTVQQYAGRFLNDDPLDANNSLFRKLVLKRLQQDPNDSWNKLLSWLYIQQKEYDKAFVQEKALYKRNPEDLNRIADLGAMAFNNNDLETARQVYTFILENTTDRDMVLDAHLALLDIAVETATSKKEIDAVEQKYQELFATFGKNYNTLSLQLSYADFLTFKKNEPERAITILKNALSETSNPFQEGSIKIKLGDVLVYTGKFNEALINYSQVQTKLKNSTLAQDAQFKVAQTSYFKGDFKWAMTQLKVLKKSTSQLIANDALGLNLLITENIAGDSISKEALEKYARAELLAYQNKNKQAIDTLDLILKKYEGRSIEDEALYKQADLYTRIKMYKDAEADYLRLISLKNEYILVDDSYFKLGELYQNYLDDPEKAKEMYQKIIFDFPSSIYLVEARKRFRILRGDAIN
ncbi:MAG: tetratricopeptide repeat protein [Flavobacteriaceae bacterium]|nr:tetratricopeptide repeat protein [Flavobacteriaceae bacterium]